MNKQDLKNIICKWCSCSARNGTECKNEPQFEHICPVEVIDKKINTKDNISAGKPNQ
jgi:hypothetical protein